MTERTHFVYRVWDEFDGLLYIGCTKNPKARWSQHKADRRSWTQYAQRFTLAGPYEKATALRIEAEAIATEQPYFNAQRAEAGMHSTRHAESQRLIRDLRARRPEFALGLSQSYGTPLWDEWVAELEQINAQLDVTHPVVTDDERHAHYLNDLRDRQENAA